MSKPTTSASDFCNTMPPTPDWLTGYAFEMWETIVLCDSIERLDQLATIIRDDWPNDAVSANLIEVAHNRITALEA